MPFVSEILGKLVSDVDGESVGVIKDVIASPRATVPHPMISAIEVKHGSKTILISLSDVAVLIAPAVPLKKKLKDIQEYQVNENDLYLARDLLDKQIIDTNGMRVVRVNDLEMTRVNGEIYISNVDVGGAGLLRRLGLPKLARRLTTSIPGGSKLGTVISWDDVELLSHDQPLRLKVPSEKLTELHPADLAEILSDLSRAESEQLLQSLDLETLADTLEEVEPDFQASLVEQMDNERVADVLEEMSPDEAADLLAELPEDRSQEILTLMEKDEAEDVRKLLTYDEDTAGGIMTTELISVHPGLTAEETICKLREMADEAETVFYIYVVDEENHLLGVFSLRELVLAQPTRKIDEFMEDRVITVNLNDDQEECAHVIAKYNLLAVPVVDEENRLHGIVTADDALDKIIPTAWKKRLPRLYH